MSLSFDVLTESLCPFFNRRRGRHRSRDDFDAVGRQSFSDTTPVMYTRQELSSEMKFIKSKKPMGKDDRMLRSFCSVSVWCIYRLRRTSANGIWHGFEHNQSQLLGQSPECGMLEQVKLIIDAFSDTGKK